MLLVDYINIQEVLFNSNIFLIQNMYSEDCCGVIPLKEHFLFHF